MAVVTPAPAVGARAEAPAHAAATGRVGPNAIVQLAAALREGPGEPAARAVFARAGLLDRLDDPPQEMVDEREAAALFAATGAELAPAAAAAVLADAGARTADYLLAHRIPRPAARLLRALPAPWSARLLLAAIRRNAWTFAGSGAFRARAGAPCRLEIAGNPLATPGCVWHVAVFEGLFRALVSRDAIARQRACCREGAQACCFEVALDGLS